jgi:hypothetical protein
MMEEHNKHGRTIDLHQQIREIMGKPKLQIGMIQSTTGTDQIENDKIIERWKEYTEELFKKDERTHTDFHERPYKQQPSVLQIEVRKALKDIAGRKATGVDQLSIELIRGRRSSSNCTNSTMPTDLGVRPGPRNGNDPYSYPCQKRRLEIVL